MGNFYVNITARTEAEEAVSFLEKKGANAYVLSTKPKECIIFEEKCDTQDIAYLHQLLIELTSEQNCSGLGVLNHDDDLLFLMLCSKGELVADYTCGISFEEMYEDYDDFDEDDDISFESDEVIEEDRHELDDEKRQQAKVMAQALSEAFEVKETDAIFDMLTEDFIFAIEAHEKLVEVLGLPELSVGLGYNYISEGQMEEEFDKSKVIQISGDNI